MAFTQPDSSLPHPPCRVQSQQVRYSGCYPVAQNGNCPKAHGFGAATARLRGSAMVNDIQLATIDKVDLRGVWENEAADFTPWLGENLTALGEALGLDLELKGQEAPVGGFSLDVLAHEPNTNRPVIIENQLETTDHDHLGKLITYASGYDANVVVWITREFKDEHRQALDWLNQRSGEDTEFFGVVIEVWKIDDSRPAPHFRVVSAPNVAEGKCQNQIHRGNVSTTGALSRLFPKTHRYIERGTQLYRSSKGTATKLVFLQRRPRTKSALRCQLSQRWCQSRGVYRQRRP